MTLLTAIWSNFARRYTLLSFLYTGFKCFHFPNQPEPTFHVKFFFVHTLFNTWEGQRMFENSFKFIPLSHPVDLDLTQLGLIT